MRCVPGEAQAGAERCPVYQQRIVVEAQSRVQSELAQMNGVLHVSRLLPIKAMGGEVQLRRRVAVEDTGAIHPVCNQLVTELFVDRGIPEFRAGLPVVMAPVTGEA